VVLTDLDNLAGNHDAFRDVCSKLVKNNLLL